jgi:putative DNA primase/helicase
MPVMAAGRTEEETEKRLGAALLAGQPIINIDNVNGELGGDWRRPFRHSKAGPKW